MAMNQTDEEILLHLTENNNRMLRRIARRETPECFLMTRQSAAVLAREYLKLARVAYVLGMELRHPQMTLDDETIAARDHAIKLGEDPAIMFDEDAKT